MNFNKIPNNLRVPLFYAEFDNSNANSGGATQEYRVLMLGNRLPSATKAALSLDRITSKEQAVGYYGAGSQLADQIAAFLDNNKVTSLYAMSLADLQAGVQATGTITLSGTPSEAGVASFMVGGRNIKIGVALTDTPTTLAAALTAAINADTLNVMSAAAAAGVVTVTMKNKGIFGNEVELSHSYYDGEALPAGLIVAFAQPSGGAGNPDVSAVWPVLGDEQFILTVSPYLDPQNLISAEAELDSRNGPLRMIEGFGLYGKRGSFGTLATLGAGRNSQYTTFMGMKGPSNPWAFAAAMAAQVAASGNNDPARPFQTLELVGILAPRATERFTLEERNQLLYSGISTFMVLPSGGVALETVITTFKKNAFGAFDESYTFLETPLTLSYLRFDWKATVTSKYPRAKLADDGTRFAPGQVVVTPKVMKAELVNKFREWELKGLVENADQFIEDLVVERSQYGKNRLDALLSPDLVNQFRVMANIFQFKN